VGHRRWAAGDEIGRGPESTRNRRERLAGLYASCLPWLHARGVAALGCDGVSDVVPSQVEGVPMPIHTVAIVAMGLHLLDNLELAGALPWRGIAGESDRDLLSAGPTHPGRAATPGENRWTSGRVC
jgi:hypothetical protein